MQTLLERGGRVKLIESQLPLFQTKAVELDSSPYHSRISGARDQDLGIDGGTHGNTNRFASWRARRIGPQ